ncbi:hypothetical protein GX865_00945 [Candidatus Saccharibacteria bacterium]|jgi:hypothetical protein|nr:hypothetical protein [Candidatus Saccharibacteria bacterium]
MDVDYNKRIVMLQNDVCRLLDIVDEIVVARNRLPKDDPIRYSLNHFILRRINRVNCKLNEIRRLEELSLMQKQDKAIPSLILRFKNFIKRSVQIIKEL